MMEKSEKNMDTSDTDSMTTVNVNMKEYGNSIEYQEAPPAYRQTQKSTAVQVTRIIAMAAVLIVAMLSISIVFSAWISASSCQQQQQSSQAVPVLEALLQPEHLKSFFAVGPAPPSTGKDLDLAESKLDNTNKDNKINNNNLNKDASSEEENSAEGDDGGVTMIKLPLELNLQEHLFERNHRSHMNCVIEKKKAEEIVDEQSKPLPAILGINMTTDPRYMHFTGEKMAISCDSGNNHRQMPPARSPVPTHPHQNVFSNLRQAPMHRPHPLRDIITSALAAAESAPVHIIGPISMGGQEGSPSEFQFQRESQQPQQSPIHFFNQFVEQQPQQHQPPQYPHQFFVKPQQGEEEQGQESNNNFGIPPHLIPILLPHQGNNNNLEDSSNNMNPSGTGPIFFHPQSSEVRERALPHPVPIMPRAHFQHGQFVIRPRRSVDNEDKPESLPQNNHKRVKRCSCDCACKNHQE